MLTLSNNDLNNVLKVMKNTNNAMNTNINLSCKENDNGLKIQNITKNKDMLETVLSSETFKDFDFNYTIKDLSNIASKLDKDSVLQFSNQNKNVEIVEGYNDQTTIKIENNDKNIYFERYDNLEETETTFNIDTLGLLKQLEKLKVATASNDNMPIITGIKFELEGGLLTLIACDGFRLHIGKIEIVSDLKTEFVIKKTCIDTLITTIKRLKTLYKKDLTETTVKQYKKGPAIVSCFQINGFKIFTQNLEGNYIDYKGILPTEFKTTVKVNKDQLIKAIQKTDIVNSDNVNNLIKFYIKDKVCIKAGEKKKNITVNLDSEKDGKDLLIGFNSHFLIDALKAIEEKDLILKFTKDRSPLLIESKNNMFIVLPVILSSETEKDFQEWK